MKKIGLVGGIGPAATVSYYLGLIEGCKQRKGEKVYPEIVIDSLDLEYATHCFETGEYEKSVAYITRSLSDLQAAGAQIAAITANTEHILWDRMKPYFKIPVISIVDAAVEKIVEMRYKRVLVLGTVFTMKSGMYDRVLKERGIVPIHPSDTDKEVIGNLIYPNLENGIVIEADRQQLIELAEKYIVEGNVDAVLLACTEIALAIRPGDLTKPVLDTTTLHIEKILECAVDGDL